MIRRVRSVIGRIKMPVWGFRVAATGTLVASSHPHGQTLKYCISSEDDDRQAVWLRAEVFRGKWGPASLAIRYQTHGDALRAVSWLRLAANGKIQIVDAPKD